jgi:hypothetical protein
VNGPVITAVLCIIGGLGLMVLVVAERIAEQHGDGSS